MTDPIEAFSTLDDFLLSLADGVAYAQAELARANATAEAQASALYQLPRVDFDLKMNLTVVQDHSLSQRYGALRPIRANDRHLLFRPVSADEASSTLEIAATVRGSFIAVPPNGGLPAPRIRVSVDASDASAPVVAVAVGNTAGEPLAGVQVEFNVDREESISLNDGAAGTFRVADGTSFARGVATTNESGVAQNVLSIDKNQQSGRLFIAVDALSRTETIVYEVAQ